MRRTWPRRCPQCPGGAPVAAVLLQHLGAASGDVRAVLGLAKFTLGDAMPVPLPQPRGILGSSSMIRERRGGQQRRSDAT